MELTPASGAPAGIEEVGKRFEQWRRTREKRGRIPEALWEAAASLYPDYSLHHISRVLHLNHAKLKHLVKETSPAASLLSGEHFIQLGLAPAISRHMIEMRHQDGSRMIVEGADHRDLIKLARLFWSRP